jgi:single-strand DNA-binding protein
MNQKVTVQGLVATTPRHLVTQAGLPITSFRVAASTQKFDEVSGKWIEGETNWYTITAFKALAINSAQSVSKGDRILLTGNLKVRDWDNGERAGTSVEIEADSIGHDLTYGTSVFERVAGVKFEPTVRHNCTCTDCDK